MISAYKVLVERYYGQVPLVRHSRVCVPEKCIHFIHLFHQCRIALLCTVYVLLNIRNVYTFLEHCYTYVHTHTHTHAHARARARDRQRNLP
jgi:hypothetical protein